MKKLRLFRNLSLVLVAMILLSGAVFYDLLNNEERDYRLYDEVVELGNELNKYKDVNGRYPASLSEAKSSNRLCVFINYPKCETVAYKPSTDFTSFKMAVQAFNEYVLFYDSTRMEGNVLVMPSGNKCYFCAVQPWQYRMPSEYFPNPEEWPEL